MPLPLAPLIPLAVRLGLVATTTFALTRLLAATASRCTRSAMSLALHPSFE